MKYYKVIKNSEFIGVGTSHDLRRFQEKHKLTLACGESQAQYIQINEQLFHAQWMIPTKQEFILSEVIEISKDEYDELHSVIENNEEIIISESGEFVEEPIIPDIYEEITQDFLLKSRIKELKKNLRDTDYMIIKIAEGVSSFEDYKDKIEQRNLWRKEINELEEQLHQKENIVDDSINS